MTNDEKIELILRRTVDIHNKETLLKKLNSGKKLIVKFGADPSRPDLHLGHTVPLRALKVLQELGHDIVFVIGDFTAMIGDPSGKSKLDHHYHLKKQEEMVKHILNKFLKY